jgi:hypothetical protein
MLRRELRVGDVVQISPETPSKFRGCFMLVTEPKSWGAQGFIAIPYGEDMPGNAYFRCKWEDMEYIGPAVWVPEDDTNPTGLEFTR